MTRTRHRLVVVTAAVALGTCESARPVAGASVGLFADLGCSSCNLTVPAGTTATFYIRALTDGIAPEHGFTGAGLSVVGLPGAWSAISTPNSEAAVSVGDPFAPTGARIGFANNIAGTCIDLYTVSLTAPVPAGEIMLRVEGVTSTWNPDVVCPLFIPGCSPCDFETCVNGGILSVNSQSGCVVGVEPSTWAHVKQLYR